MQSVPRNWEIYIIESVRDRKDVARENLRYKMMHNVNVLFIYFYASDSVENTTMFLFYGL